MKKPCADFERDHPEIPATFAATCVGTGEWRVSLPVLRGDQLLLREVKREDAASLLTMLSTAEVARFITPPPSTVEGFETFIDWAHSERRKGQYACYAVIPEGMQTPVGLFQVRPVQPGFATAEWGFVLDSAFWGRGVFQEAAQMILNFIFGVIGVHRLEARVAVANGRGNGALRKIGAVQEGLLRRSFLRNGRYHDQALWSMLADDWQFMQISSNPGFTDELGREEAVKR